MSLSIGGVLSSKPAGRKPGKASGAPSELATLLAKLEELQRRTRERPLDFYTPLPHGKAFHADPSKERWLIGANGSGKTVIGAAEVCSLVEGRAAWWSGPPGEVWCGAVSLADSEKVQRPAIRAMLRPDLIQSWPNEHNPNAPSTLTLNNGWVIRFMATRQGREAWQGGNVALVWFDEEPDADVFDEGFSRTRTGGRVILTFTPLQGLKWDKAYQRVYVPWLEFKRRNPDAKHGTVAPGLSVFTAGTADNTNLPPSEIEAQRAQFADRPLMLRARLYGEWLDTSEDAIVPVDKLGEHSYTLNDPPQGGWAAKAIWIDSAFSKNATSDRFCLSLAARATDGRVYLLDQVFGRLSADERVTASVKAIRDAGCPPTYVQRTTPDGEFAVRLNDALMRSGLPALVRQYPDSGPVPGKVERAQSYAAIVGNGQSFVRRDHLEFKREAGTFPNAEHDDVFDSGMGAQMVLLSGVAPAMFSAAVAQSNATKRRDTSERPPEKPKHSMDWIFGGGNDLLSNVD